MTPKQKTVVVTGASQGIGAALANLFLDRGYNVVANSRNVSRTKELHRSDSLALVDGDIGRSSTAEKIVATAVNRYGSPVTFDRPWRVISVTTTSGSSVARTRAWTPSKANSPRECPSPAKRARIASRPGSSGGCPGRANR